MKVTQRYEKRYQEAKDGMASEVIRQYSAEIEAEKKRQMASRNSFVRTCCQQTMDQLSDERKAIEKVFIG